MSRRHLKYKVILLGNLGVGKTSMFRRLRDGSLRYNNDDNVNVSLDKHTKAFRVESGETVFVSGIIMQFFFNARRFNSTSTSRSCACVMPAQVGPRF